MTARSRLTTVLGPTNTGKTHFAVERMLAHRSGMIGFPLRLLARENYDRIVRLKGEHQVALITGEEKIVPAEARYFVCTVESMPFDREVAFLAVDEIQLAADRERGHVFTDRLLHARGIEETMVLGAETARALIRQLVPDAEFVARPRFSKLSYAGSKKFSRLPRRSAVVAFSAADVYAMAETIRRHRGGAAVVMGALSPRTRNAQVAMFQSGEVDFLVATDAIGMGLNMDLDHVAFARLSKFDGRVARRLSHAEIAQIAGRAGRHMNDGTFGVTAELETLDPMVIDAVENHRFDPLRLFYWRNTDLDFSSLAALNASLTAPPPHGVLARAPESIDQLTLQSLSRQSEIASLAGFPTAVRLLWDSCQIPDFGKTLTDSHMRLVAQVFRFIAGPEGRLPEDWVARSIDRLDRTDGDIDTLTSRLAHIRTWTYVAYRGGWLADPLHWQERARDIEDRLSDALHERLTQRFVERRSAFLVQRMQDTHDLLAAVTPSGDVVVEGQFVGRLEGFRFVVDTAASKEESRLLARAALKALRGEIGGRVRRLVKEPDEAFSWTAEGRILWRGVDVARLVPGAGPLAPTIEIVASDLFEAVERETVRRRLTPWMTTEIQRALAPLFRAQASTLPGVARGIVYQLAEGLGTVGAETVAAQIAALDEPASAALNRLDIRLGPVAVFMPALLREPALAMRALLWRVVHGKAADAATLAGRTSVRREEGLSPEDYRAVGFVALASRAIRADMANRLAQELSALTGRGPAPLPRTLASMIGCRSEEIGPLLGSFGYRIYDSAAKEATSDRSTKDVKDRPRNGRADKSPVMVARSAALLRRQRLAARGAGDGIGGEGPGGARDDSPFALLRHVRLRHEG